MDSELLMRFKKLKKCKWKIWPNWLIIRLFKNFRENALNPEHPVTRGTAQNPDIYFQASEAGSVFYDDIPDIVENYMKEIKKITGREYHPFNYYGAKDAEHIIIAMGSVTSTIKEVIDHLDGKRRKSWIDNCSSVQTIFREIFYESISKNS